MRLLILASSLLILAVVGFSQNEHHVVKRQSQNYIRACYFTNWAKYRTGRGTFSPDNYVSGLCTHILFAFGWMNEDFTVRAYDPSDLPTDWAGAGQYAMVNQLKQRDSGLKTLLSFGGYTFGTRLFEAMSANPTTRGVFINSVIHFVRQYNFDGIDIDWEYPAGHSSQFTLLMKELRTAIEGEAPLAEKPKLLLTAAVAAGASNIDAYEVSNIAGPLDFINLMTYDFWGAWDGETGMNAPLYSRAGLGGGKEKWNVDWAANEWARRGMPKNKIVIGMGTYGRGWTLANAANIQPGSTGNQVAPAQPYTAEAGIAAYYEICEFLAKGGTRYWHAEHQVPWVVYQNQWWSYDDQQSFKAKTDYIKKNGFAGAMVWTLDLDDFNGQCPGGNGVKFPLIAIIVQELGGGYVPNSNGTTIKPGTSLGPPKPASTKAASTNLPITTTPTAAPVNPTSGAFTCDGKVEGGFYQDPADCGSFYRCVYNSPVHFQCGPGTYWHQDLLTCSYGKTSGCV
ncbi:unnamed protein product, partial [Mesorhabditis spiculigera]